MRGRAQAERRAIAESELLVPVEPDAIPPLALVGEAVAPTRWDIETVAARLIEAAATIRRMPMKLRPSGYHTCWPVYAMEPGDQAALLNDAMLSGTLNDLYVNRKRAVIPPSAP